EQLGSLLQQAISGSQQPGARVSSQDGVLSVVGFPIERIGELAAENGIVLHELSPQSGSLEEAFIQLTNSSVEYNAHDPAVGTNGPGGDPAAPGQPGGQAGQGFGGQSVGGQGFGGQGFGGQPPAGFGD